MTEIEHGTPRGYRQHHRLNEAACDDCKAGQAKEQREYTYRRHFNKGPLMVPALGAHRRIRGMLRMGWRLEDIAKAAKPELVSGKKWAGLIMRRQKIQLSTHIAVDMAYRQLSAKRGPSQRNATLALNRGWPPPMAWDNIDSPVCKPTGYYRPSEFKKLKSGTKA